MSDLQPNHYKDLSTYHTALRQFLDVSNASAKSNPKRAAKARDKLLKLSATQFYELSTDVYDELERRIDESRDEPDFLLPKSTFHPKRNEAREKLGSLQQVRFRDLVSDIFFEIERRNYHNQKGLQSQPENEKRHSINSLDYAKNKSAPNGVQKLRESDPSSNKNGVVSLQSTTVIPTKAELAWSSDEEEVEELKSHQSYQTQRQSHQDYNNRNSDLQKQLSRSNRNSDLSSKKRNSNVSDRDTISELVETAPKHGSQVSRGLSVSKARNKDREIELLLEEGTKMDQTITQLEQKIALLQSKSDKFENETKDLKKINENLNSKISSLESNLSEKDQNLKELQSSQPTENSTRDLQFSKPTGEIDQTQLDGLRKEIVNWRSKFEDLKLKKIDDLLSINTISSNQTSKFIDSTGLIPLNLVTLLHKNVESFLLFLNKEKHGDSKIEVNPLFDHISTIANISGKISSFVPHSEKSDLIRASISHAITSTRYFALYAEFLPKLIVESAVSEITFSVCELISDVKVNKDTSKYNASEFEVPNNFSKNINNDDGLNEISPVRPLKMTQKVLESPKTETPKPTPRPLNLTINSQQNSTNMDASKKGIYGFSTPISSTAEGSRGFNINNVDNNKSPSSTTTPLRKNGLPSVISRYSPESDRKSPDTTTPISGLRKSSSGNILSKVRQFEQQVNGNDNIVGNGKNSPQRVVVSPFSDSKFGKSINGVQKRSSVDSQATESSSDLKNNSKIGIETVKSDVKSSYNDTKNGLNNQQATRSLQNDDINNHHEKGLKDNSVDDDDDFTSVDDLKGAIKKNADLKPKNEVNELPVSNKEVDLNAYEDDLNEASDNYDREVKNELSKPLPSSNGVNLNKSYDDDDDDDGDVKIERKHVKEGFVDSGKLSNGVVRSIESSVKPLDLGHKDTTDNEKIFNKNTESAKEVFNSAQQYPEGEDESEVESNEEDNKKHRVEGRDVEEDFDVRQFDIEDPDNTLSELLLYLEHQTVKVISTIQTLLTSIKAAESTKGELRSGSRAINAVVSQMVDATSNSMNQSRNAQLKEHGIWVVQSLEDSGRRMDMLCNSSSRAGEENEDDDEDYADKHFKQRLAGIAFDVAKCTKELVKTVEEANLKEEIAHLDAKLSH